MKAAPVESHNSSASEDGVDVEAFIRRLKTTWRTLDPQAFRELCHPNAVIKYPTVSEPLDPEGLEAYWKGLMPLMPDLHVELRDWIASDDVVVFRSVMSTTINSKKVTWYGMERAIVKDGKALEVDAYFDTHPVREAMASTPAVTDATPE